MKARELKVLAQGRWPSIHSNLGIPAKILNGRQQPCPHCGGKDRFRYSNHKDSGSYYCNACGSGTGLDLLMIVHGWSFPEAMAGVESVLGVATYKPTRPLKHARRAELLNDLWRESRTIRKSDPAALYLSRRCGLTRFPSVLRAHKGLVYTDPEGNSTHPGLVAMVQSADGTCQTLHRTFLTEDGDKADLPSPRRIMPGAYETGSCVRLMPFTETLGIAEGIETAFSAAQLFRVPVWAALNAHNLAQFAFPDGLKRLLVFGDADRKFAGQAAAYRLAERAANKGFEVSVHIPDVLGQDWNDVALRKE